MVSPYSFQLGLDFVQKAEEVELIIIGKNKPSKKLERNKQ